MVEHLTALEENINHYFPSLNTEKYDWVRNSFVDVPSNIGFKLCEEELATISSDRSLKIIIIIIIMVIFKCYFSGELIALT